MEITKEIREKRKSSCSYRRYNCCFAYEGVSVPCNGHCNWVLHGDHRDAPGANNIALKEK